MDRGRNSPRGPQSVVCIYNHAAAARVPRDKPKREQVHLSSIIFRVAVKWPAFIVTK